ncbi:GGDEF domain-containing protein [Sphingomonas sp. AP4-R1]|uniref:GGDEF domain-containing protein n=1 Tax=Sphingomonas sp. AP4-R1 TaxID=2735134 RepID=UPI001493787E|nr:GGDEF domain-containing protein [Sphingomonas sp. AP4-R1]QJU56851.1 GGDEF domain-containing protein [Sphingomonas sp. AP4-R1]
MNTLLGAMFAASFLVIAYLNPSVRGTRWMALSYGFGIMEPVSHLAVVLGADVATMKIVAPCTFLTGLALMAPALSIFHRKRPMWRMCAAIILCGLFYYGFVPRGPTDSFWHELSFQSFCAASMFLCAATVRRDAPGTRMNKALTIVFIVAGLHFLVKPAVAATVGTDGIDENYAASLYAVFSQSSGGVLLVAAGLLILISVLQSVVQANHAQAHTDPLTGLPNRRALYEAFQSLSGKPDVPALSIAIVDIDRFKAINDQLGHDRGDEVLRSVADCLQRTCLSPAIPARLGGEEFVVLLPGCDGEKAMLVCECIRLSIFRLSIHDLAAISVSIGLTGVLKGEDLTDALRRADRALYDAKHSGRNRCVSVPMEEKDGDRMPPALRKTLRPV